jgi:hypothetical protein
VENAGVAGGAESIYSGSVVANGEAALTAR